MSDYKYPRISERINGKELAIWGVEHTREFFNQYKPLFEDLVRDNDVVVLEQMVGGDFWESNFFGRVGELARGQGKKVYQIDPVGLGNFLLDLGTTFAGGALIYNGVRGSKSQEKTTRRNFLKRMGKLALGLPLVAGGLPGRLLLENLTTDISVSYGVDDQLGYGSCDYRNIVIAEGLARICNEVRDVSRICSIHGASHSEAVHEYLLSQNKRQKRLVYLPHDILGNTKIREYTPTSKGWELTSTF